MSPDVPNPANWRRLSPLILVILVAYLSSRSGKKLALTEGGEPEWTRLMMSQELPELGPGLGILAMACRSRAL